MIGIDSLDRFVALRRGSSIALAIVGSLALIAPGSARAQSAVAATISQAPAGSSVTDPASADHRAALPTLRALCVGAGAFGDRRLRPIPQAANDARAVAAALLAQRGRGLYGAVDVTVVADKDATSGRVQQEIEHLGAKARAGDVTVLYFCGYQTADDDGRARFVTSDLVIEKMERTAPLLSAVHHLLLDLPSGHALVLLDLIHGDPMAVSETHRGWVTRGGGLMSRRIFDPGLTTSDLPKTVRLLFSATGQEQCVDAVPGRTPPIGAFAATLADALEGHAAAAPNAPAITAGDVCRFVQASVAKIASDRQHPYVPFAGDPFDDFAIARAASGAPVGAGKQ